MLCTSPLVFTSGKSTTCEQLSEALGFRYINLGKCVASQSLYSGWDPKFEAHIIDEDKVQYLALKLSLSSESKHIMKLNYQPLELRC